MRWGIPGTMLRSRGCRIPVVLLATSLLACKAKIKENSCKQALRHAAQMEEASGEVFIAANPTMAASARPVIEDDIARLRKRFVAACVEFDEADFECMETLGSYAEPFIAAAAKDKECAVKTPFSPECESRYADEVSADYGACKDVYERIKGELMERPH